MEKTNVTARYISSAGKDLFEIFSNDFETTKQIIQHSLSELPPIEYLRLKYEFEWIEFIDYIWIDKSKNDYSIMFVATPNLSKWNYMFSFGEYCDELSRVIKTGNNADIEFEQYKNDQPYVNIFEVRFPFLHSQQPIANEIVRTSDMLHAFHNDAMTSLASRIRDNSVAMYFDFPEEVRIPCEQYLLYFVQFLHDLGIKAASELKHEAGHVLFAIRPLEKQDALDKIRVALEIYLKLSNSPINISAEESDIAIQKLIANIHHLKEQLALSQAILQAKDATIQTQQFTINQQQHLLTGNIFMETLTHDYPKTKEKEELLGGTFSITKYEGKGFEINLPEVFRKLKKLFHN